MNWLPEPTSEIPLFTHADTAQFMREKMREIALQAADKPVLTEEEKFAICMMAGAPVEVIPFDLRDEDRRNTVSMRTSVPCAVTRINGKWHVTIGRREHGRLD